jgi:hypothetical protein
MGWGACSRLCELADEWSENLGKPGLFTSHSLPKFSVYSDNWGDAIVKNRS